MDPSRVVQEDVDPIQNALYDELDKIGASRHRMAVPQSRSGRRPMSVETMLRKDREGTLFKSDHGKEVKVEPAKEAEAVTALLAAMDKVAESLGLEAARTGMGKVNPTLAGAQEAHAAYSGLPDMTRKLIESHPLVTQHGMTPQAAMQVAGWSLKPGQSVGDFFAGQHQSMLANSNASGGGAPPSSATMSTRATPRPISAAPASGVRTVAGAGGAPGPTMPSAAGAAPAARPAPSIQVAPTGAAPVPQAIAGRSIAAANPLGKTLGAGPAPAAAAALPKAKPGIFSGLVGAAAGAPPAQVAMKSIAQPAAGAAKALGGALKPGGAMANVLRGALGKVASLGLADEFLMILDKAAAELTPQGRAEISKKNFALTGSQSSTGQCAYPIQDEAHARAALGFVGMHGSESQRHEVYKDIARKYPHLAAKSSIPALKGLVKEKDANLGSDTMGVPGMGGSQMGMGPQDKMGAAKVAAGIIQRLAAGLGSTAGTHKAELAGLGILAAPAADHLQARIRSGLAGEGAHGAEKRQLMGETGHALTELGGLGVLAGPSIAHLAVPH